MLRAIMEINLLKKWGVLGSDSKNTTIIIQKQATNAMPGAS
jgi:hypothetical protein